MKIRMVSALALFCALTLAAGAQDARWLRMWERAQEERPGTIGSESRIADPDEPGTPLVINGRVWDAEGEKPLAEVVVFAYQTDETGVYHARGADDWRLRGWAKTDEEGRFLFRTTRPGSYPSRSAPAHVHFTIEGPGVERQWTSDLMFGDDPLIDRAKRRKSRNPNRFDEVRPVETRDGVQYVNLNLKATGQGRF